MKLPGPDHPIAITRAAKRVRFAARIIADSTRVLTLKEASYPPVFCVPRADADMNALQRSKHRSHCPYKGEASYFSIAANGRSAENAVWSYEQPFPAVKVKEIAGRLAFYPNRVNAFEEG